MVILNVALATRMLRDAGGSHSVNFASPSIIASSQACNFEFLGTFRVVESGKRSGIAGIHQGLSKDVNLT